MLSDTSQVASYSYGRRFRYNADESVEEFMAIVDQIVITPEG